MIVNNNLQAILLNLVDQPDLAASLTPIGMFDDIGTGLIDRHFDRIHGPVIQASASGCFTYKLPDTGQVFEIAPNCKLIAVRVHELLLPGIVYVSGKKEPSPQPLGQ